MNEETEFDLRGYEAALLNLTNTRSEFINTLARAAVDVVDGFSPRRSYNLYLGRTLIEQNGVVTKGVNELERPSTELEKQVRGDLYYDSLRAIIFSSVGLAVSNFITTGFVESANIGSIDTVPEKVFVAVTIYNLLRVVGKVIDVNYDFKARQWQDSITV